MPAIPVVYPRSTEPGVTRRADVVFSDLDTTDAWAREAIRWVAGTNDWMRDTAAADDGTYRFKPDAFATRKYTARAIVKAFAADEEPDPTVVFTDLDPSSPWYRYASVAVAHGWMRRSPDGAFLPDDRVTTIALHRALVLALGLRPAARALDRIHTVSGTTFDTPGNFGTTMLGLRLGLRYNFPSGSESKDVTPSDELRRAYVAYSLWRATTQPAYSISDLLEQYANVELPHLGPKKSAIVQWGVRFIGFPYYWGGEWGFEGGAQVQPGFDCSGLTWWLLRRNDGGWRVAPPRPYRGWMLPERSSADMARGASDRLRFGQLRPGDMMFYDGDDDGVVDHVDTYIGNGYSLDSSSTPGGVTVMWVGDGWYREHFTYGRRVLRG
jgi:cell wall-associated NlpC family hydrolase